MNTVFITGADRGIGFAMVEEFAQAGWTVFAGQYMPDWPQLAECKKKYFESLIIIPLDVSKDESVAQAVQLVSEQTDTLDMLISVTGIALEDRPDEIRRMIDVNSLAALRLTNGFLTLMENGQKRLCYVTSEAGSITTTQRDGSTQYGMCAGYGISKGMLNMAVRLLFNRLRPLGYKFRLYNPGWVQSYIDGPLMQTYKFKACETARVARIRFSEDREWEDVLVLTDVEDQIWSF